RDRHFVAEVARLRVTAHFVAEVARHRVTAPTRSLATSATKPRHYCQFQFPEGSRRVGYNGAMAKKRAAPAKYVQPYRYPSPNIPMSAIRRFARQIAERFHPEKIILFGSYAYGTPHAESDVDLLVVMPARNAVDQAIRICGAFDRPFSYDL